MSIHFRICKPLLLSLSLLIPAVANGDEDWPTFRGPERTNVAPDTDLLEQWPSGGPSLLWKASGLGIGYSSVSIVDGRIYTMGDHLPDSGSDEYLICLDQDGGDLIWKMKTGPAWENGKEDWQSTRSTPTVDGNRVYALTAFGELICASTDGEEIWRRNLKEEFSGKKADSWGYSESVLIDGDTLVCTPGGPENTMLALDKKTGEKKWSTSRPEDRGAGHASVVISHVGGEKVYVNSTGSGAMGVRASDGELLWTFDIDKTTAVIPTPIVRDDLVFFCAGYNRGGALLRQVPAGSGKVNMEVVYPLQTHLSNKHGGVVLVGDYIYGGVDSNPIPFCADLMTGEQKWKGRGTGSGSVSVVAADGHLYFRYQSGEVSLVKATPEKFERVSEFTVPGSGGRPSWAHPVILEGKLYLREGNDLLCYDIKK
ncbi:outer membrane biogenesis protein BamB [Thalassoglobus neptunius]|uniref:Outer membrane biogenesis protein BamB n=1 Tax=Thalassoglobus neptunius TaxID=1938619 RepID=A0A5C5X5I3_9PLAN|nr:PQQ-binding-like beta-propeller repeat protein [Thalassoglobus neptunius]TWT58184.1 outer membrane biogenesis protein BamB [Thalassoglobus neptunius]